MKKWGNPYRYTRPLGPISARFRGPGPAKYRPHYTVGRHNPDSTNPNAPKYTIRPKCPISFQTVGPGPAAYGLEPGLVRRGPYTESGKTFGLKTNISQWTNKMSPADYKHEYSKSTKDGYNPKYSMRARTRYFRTDGAPAPNRYTLPSVMGGHQTYTKESPVYSMRPKTHYDKTYEIPGPGAYKDPEINDIRPRAPKYTMRPKTEGSKFLMTLPAPNAYSRHLVTANERRAPKFSMGMRHSEFTTPLIVEVSDNLQCQ